MQLNQDGYANAVVGHGMAGRDSTAGYRYLMPQILSDHELMSLFMGAMGRKIINLPADEATKNWIEIEGDEEDQERLALQMLDDLGAEAVFSDALRWSRLYGGSVILMLANDGGRLEDELNESRLQGIEKIRAYDRTQVYWNEAVLYDDPVSRQYGEPMYYQIQPMGGVPFLVHESRLLKFTGESLPDYYRIQYQGWGMPVFQGMVDELRNNGVSYELALKIMERMSQAVLKLEGLLQVLEQEDGEEQVKKRLQLIDMARSILNTIAIDKEDEFDVKNMTLATIPDIIDRFGLALSAVCNIPFSILFGRSPAGMNATGESDMENWYNTVKQIQKRQLKKPLDRLVKLLILSKQGLFKGKEPERWAIKFNPLWLPSDKEQAITEDTKAGAKVKDAQAMALKLQNKVISRAEWQRQEGFSEAEIGVITKEIDGETNLDLSGVLGHGF